MMDSKPKSSLQTLSESEKSLQGKSAPGV